MHWRPCRTARGGDHFFLESQRHMKCCYQSHGLFIAPMREQSEAFWRCKRCRLKASAPKRSSLMTLLFMPQAPTLLVGEHGLVDAFTVLHVNASGRSKWTAFTAISMISAPKIVEHLGCVRRTSNGRLSGAGFTNTVVQSTICPATRVSPCSVS